MRDGEWLEGLKAGDDVFITARYGQPDYPAKIKRRTSTQIVVEIGNGLSAYEVKFRVKDGCDIGGDAWNRSHLVKPTDELRDAFKLQNLKSKAAALIAKLVIPKTLPEVEAFINALGQLFPPKADK